MMFLLLLVSAVGAIGYAVARDRNWAEMVDAWMPRTPVDVETVEKRTGAVPDAVVVATGYLQSRREAAVGAKMAGRISELRFEEGTEVKQGEVMVVLEHADLDAALDMAKAGHQMADHALEEHMKQLEQLVRDFLRAEKAWKKEAITEAELERIKSDWAIAKVRQKSLSARVTEAEAEVRLAEHRQDEMVIRAPFDGTVVSKDAEIGESILPGGMGEASGRGSVATIADLNQIEVDAEVKEDYVNRLSVGLEAEVVVDARPGKRYLGRVRKIIPKGDRARGTVSVRVDVPNANGELFPEMGSTVHFLAPKAEGAPPPDDAVAKIYCSDSAVVRDGDKAFVWQVDQDDELRRVTVTLGPSQQGRTEILTGLAGGESVVVNPGKNLADGQKVEAAR